MPRKRFTDEQIAFALRQAENSRLKRLVADLTPGRSMLREVLGRKW